MGSLMNLVRFRGKVADPYRPFSEEANGDGTTKVFHLAHWPVRSGTHTAWVDGAVQAHTGNYTAEVDDGRMRFWNAPPTGAVVAFVGHHSVFSDAELADVLSDYSIVTGATAASYGDLDAPHLVVVEMLMQDAAKRADWGAAGGQRVSEGQIFDSLKKMREVLVGKSRGAEIGPQGGLEGWSETQEEYGEPYGG